ncbi:MAG: peptidase T [Eubacteriales bacterium]|nr:peptidase T [Eubacteriales bacterium]
MDALTRFLKYVKIETESEEANYGQTPSSEAQWDLARVLVEELKEMGIRDAYVDDFCTVYAHIPATSGYEDRKAFGFIAHMDTVVNGKGIKPRIIGNYDGKDVTLENGVVLRTEQNPELSSLVGRTLVVTDGTTILGADDKAGVAAIMRMCEMVMGSSAPHGKICVAFTPDEEIGGGVLKFDLEAFGADYAVTVDGGAEDTIESENFHAVSAKVRVKGVEAHPGSAKGIMVNAARILTEFAAALPAGEVPEQTEDREGFFHLLDMKGNVEEASASLILRDFEREGIDRRKQIIKALEASLNEKYGEGVVSVEIKNSYSNMKEIVEQHPSLLKNIEKAIGNAGMTPKYLPIRGGTDGCQLSYKGLPCPNIGAGGYGFHGVHEHCTAEGMENAARVMCGLVEIYAGKDA